MTPVLIASEQDDKTSNQMDVESQESFSIESHESTLSQTTREVQKRSVCFDFEFEASQVVEFDSFESESKKSSDEEDLSASFLSCAVSPSPSSIVSKEENQVTVTTTQNVTDKDTVITQEEIDAISLDFNDTIKPNRTVQVRVF